MNNLEFAAKALSIANNYATAYVWGCFGWPINAANIERAVNAYPSYNGKRRSKLLSLTGIEAYMFDCVGLIKAILWGWCGNYKSAYGGAAYGTSGVPDIDADTMINRCPNAMTNFSNIEIGEVVWLTGHIGIYIGGGKVVEATPSWSDGVQLTACLNQGTISGLNGRSWTKHGKIPWIAYVDAAEDADSNRAGVSGTVKTELEEDEVRYSKLSDIPNKYGFKDIVETLMNAEIIQGDGSDPDGNDDVIDLSHDQVRMLVFLYRGGAFDRALIKSGMTPAVSG